jgi:hypothetical protein
MVTQERDSGVLRRRGVAQRLAVVGSVGVLGLALASFAASLVAAPAPIRKETDAQVAARLVQQLASSKDAETRDLAYSRLCRLGLPGLAPANRRFRTGSGEGWRLACKYFRAMQDKHGPQPLSSDGLALHASGDLVLRLPPPGCSTPAHFEVRVTNVGNRAVSFEHGRSIRPRLVSAAGKHQAPGASTDGLVLLPPVPLANGETITVKFAHGSLHRAQDGILSLVVADKRAWYTFEDIKPGPNYLYFECTIREPEKGDSLVVAKKHPRWVGDAESCFLCIDVR